MTSSPAPFMTSSRETGSSLPPDLDVWRLRYGAGAAALARILRRGVSFGCYVRMCRASFLGPDEQPLALQIGDQAIKVFCKTHIIGQ
jgi:hypothetical protein